MRSYRRVGRCARLFKPNATAPRLPTAKAINTRIQGEAPPWGAAAPVIGKPTNTVGVAVGAVMGVPVGAGVIGVFVGALGIARALRDPEVSRGSIAAGAAAGLVIAAGMMPSMKLRLHRRRATA